VSGKYEISIIDSHVAGEPLRLITGGPRLKGNTIYEKQLYMQKHFDFIRTSTMFEPRGHADMFGAVLTDPTDPRADLGILFINGGYYDYMCGHGSIGVGCIAVDMGLVKVEEPITSVVLETIAGLITVKVDVVDGKTVGATLQGVPSFLYKPNVKLDLFGREIIVDIAYGGNFFAIVDFEQFGLEHSIKYSNEFIKYGKEVRIQANKAVKVCHPEYPCINWISDILFTGNPKFLGDTYKSLGFCGEVQLDRSPCGTGTSARMAMLSNKGLLTNDEIFRHESIIGTIFEGIIGDKVKVGSFDAIIPLIKGRGYITGVGNLIISDDDPLKNGFLLR